MEERLYVLCCVIVVLDFLMAEAADLSYFRSEFLPGPIQRGKRESANIVNGVPPTPFDVQDAIFWKKTSSSISSFNSSGIKNMLSNRELL